MDKDKLADELRSITYALMMIKEAAITGEKRARIAQGSDDQKYINYLLPVKQSIETWYPVFMKNWDNVQKARIKSDTRYFLVRFDEEERTVVLHAEAGCGFAFVEKNGDITGVVSSREREILEELEDSYANFANIDSGVGTDWFEEIDEPEWEK